MKHNYCRSVSTNGWLVGNSVMTECAQVGCNRVLNEWSRPHTHPPQCRCRLQQLPSGWLIHRCVWDKKSAMYTKQHGWKTIAMLIHLSWPHQFECSHGEVVITSSEMLSEIRLGAAGRSFRFDFGSLYPSRHVIPSEPCVRPPVRRQSRPFLAFPCLRVICASALKPAQMDGSRVIVQSIQRKTQCFKARFYPSSLHIQCPFLTLISCLKISG